MQMMKTCCSKPILIWKHLSIAISRILFIISAKQWYKKIYILNIIDALELFILCKN